MKGLKELVRLRICVGAILRRAELRRDLTTFSSNIHGTGYVIDKTRALIVTTDNGYLIASKDDLPELISDLQYLYEEIERRSRD